MFVVTLVVFSKERTAREVIVAFLTIGVIIALDVKKG